MTSDRREARLDALLGEHRAAVREFVTRANAIDESRWLIPRGEGKWTPAQETRHLILAYEAFSKDLSGGPPMALRGTPWRRRLWRVIGLTSVLWRKKVPVGVRAPREARPEWETTPRPQLIAEFASHARDFDTLFTRLWHDEPDRRMTHPYIGPLSLEHAIRFNAVHIRHHAAFLPAVEG